MTTTSTSRRSSSESLSALLDAGGLGRNVELRFSTRADGDFHLDQPAATLAARRRRFVDLPWSQPDESHGVVVGEVRHPGDRDRARADALVTDSRDAVIGIWVGDCAPIALISESGRIGGVHAGWRGLMGGIVANAVARMRRDPGEHVAAVLGPCIHPCCYEFGAADLRSVGRRFGEGVVSVSAETRPALDLPAAVRSALADVGVELVDRSSCTGCQPDRFFSHRVRGERERQMMAVWGT